MSKSTKSTIKVQPEKPMLHALKIPNVQGCFKCGATRGQATLVFDRDSKTFSCEFTKQCDMRVESLLDYERGISRNEARY